MKNKKIFTAVLLLAATLLFFSCNLKVNTSQSAHYEAFIANLKALSSVNDVSAELVKITLTAANAGADTLGYQIEDKDPGKPIAQGTREEDLRKRFVVPKKIAKLRAKPDFFN